MVVRKRMVQYIRKLSSIRLLSCEIWSTFVVSIFHLTHGHLSLRLGYIIMIKETSLNENSVKKCLCLKMKSNNYYFSSWHGKGIPDPHDLPMISHQR